MTPEGLRAALPVTWGALLARYGTPTEVQLAAAEPLLAGRDALLVAPTAAGKTVAYLAPLVERVRPGDAPRLLVISPTRALVNDLHRRIEVPLDRLGIASGRWTGDHHDGGRLQPVTVLTPEALDARVSRDPAALAEVRAIVLDELHVVDGTARGDQLRVLLGRLRWQLRARGLQVAAASATVADADGMANRYLVDPAVVRVGDRRPVRARVVEAEGPQAVHEALVEAGRLGLHKILVFVRSREDVETYAAACRGRAPWGDAVFAHHGSLSRTFRLRVEQAFRTRPAALCFATGTLELGIDIGDIELVALVGIPTDLESFLQRVGRGARRSPESAVLCLAGGPLEAQAFRALLRAQAEGTWLEDPYAFRPGVLVQQAVSLAHENPAGWVSAAALHARLDPALRAAWPEERLARVLEVASLHGLLAGGGPRFGVGDRAQAHWTRGRLHANLADRPGVEIRDSMTGEAVGTVLAPDGASVQLGGRGRHILRSDDRAVPTAAAEGAELASFTTSRGRPPVSRALALHLLGAWGVPVPSHLFAGGPVLVHGLGSAGAALLDVVLRDARVKVRRMGPLAVVLRDWPRAWPGPSSVEPSLAKHHAGIGAQLELGAWHHLLPEQEQREAVRAAAPVDAVMALLARGNLPGPLASHAGDLGELAWW